MPKHVTKSVPTMRCRVSGAGSVWEVGLLHAITVRVIEGVLYDTGRLPEQMPPAYPTEDGTYLLIDNVWSREA